MLTRAMLPGYKTQQRQESKEGAAAWARRQERSGKAAPSPSPALAGSRASGFLLIPPGSIFVSQQGVNQIIKDMEILDAKNSAATPDSSSEDEHSPLADAKCIDPGASQGKPRGTMKAGGKTA